MKVDQERVKNLLIDTITLLCKNGLQYDKRIRLEGLLGISIDDSDVFFVHLSEIVSREQIIEQNNINYDTNSNTEDSHYRDNNVKQSTNSHYRDNNVKQSTNSHYRDDNVKQSTNSHYRDNNVKQSTNVLPNESSKKLTSSADPIAIETVNVKIKEEKIDDDVLMVKEEFNHSNDRLSHDDDDDSYDEDYPYDETETILKNLQDNFVYQENQISSLDGFNLNSHFGNVEGKSYSICTPKRPPKKNKHCNISDTSWNSIKKTEPMSMNDSQWPTRLFTHEDAIRTDNFPSMIDHLPSRRAEFMESFEEDSDISSQLWTFNSKKSNLERKFKCQVSGCMAAFTQSRNLRRHETVRHGRHPRTRDK